MQEQWNAHQESENFWTQEAGTFRTDRNTMSVFYVGASGADCSTLSGVFPPEVPKKGSPSSACTFRPHIPTIQLDHKGPNNNPDQDKDDGGRSQCFKGEEEKSTYPVNSTAEAKAAKSLLTIMSSSTT